MVSLLRDDIYLRAKTNADFHHKFSHLSKCLNSEWEVGDDLWRLTSETRFPVHDNEINDQDIRSTFEEYLRKDDSQFKNATEMCRENTRQRDFEAESTESARAFYQVYPVCNGASNIFEYGEIDRWSERRGGDGRMDDPSVNGEYIHKSAWL